jgi:hypothetical protein
VLSPSRVCASCCWVRLIIWMYCSSSTIY